MSRRGKLRFQTKERVTTAKKRRLTMAFVVFLLILGTVSTVAFLRAYDYDLSNLFDGRQHEPESALTTKPFVADTSKSPNLLIYGLSEDKTDLRYLAVVHVNQSDTRLLVCPLSPHILAQAGGSTRSLADHYLQGGPTRLREAIEQFGGIKIDRHAASTDKGFISALRVTGNPRVTVDAAVNYNDNDLRLVLAPGEQVLNGDTLLRYLRYNALQGDAGLAKQADIFCAMLNTFINTANLERGEEFFSRLFNTLTETDIGIGDYVGNRAAMLLFADPAQRKPAETVAFLEDFALYADDETGEEIAS